MKVCLVSLEYPPETGGGGIGTQTFIKAHGLSRRGHEVHVVCASATKQDRTYTDGAVNVHRIAEPSLGVAGYEQSTYWLAYSMAAAEKLHLLSQSVAFDLIQFPEYCGEGFVFQTDTFRNRKARYVVQCHGPLSMIAEHMGWPEIGGVVHQIGCFMEKMVIHHADLVLASSACTAQYCASQYDYPANKIQVVHSGIDTSVFAPSDQSPDVQGPKLLFVGNFTGSKGFNLLLDTVLRLRDRYPAIMLRMIGKGDEDQLRAARERIRAAGCEQNVDIRGYVPYLELPRHYAWCDIFAGPSDYEPGPGNVYLEAMAAGRPVIACNSGGAPEIVQDGVTGLLIPPRDTIALENAIATLADDATLRTRLGANGRLWVEENVAIEKYIDKIERLYMSLTPA